MNKLDLRKFENKFGMGSTLPVVYKVNELVDSLTTTNTTVEELASRPILVRLGTINVTPSGGFIFWTGDDKSDQGNGKYYTSEDIKIKRVIFLTNLNTNYIDGSTAGIMGIKTTIEGVGETSYSRTISNVLNPPTTFLKSYGFADNNFVFETIIDTDVITAYDSFYQIQIELTGITSASIARFEVYVEIEKV